MTAPVEGSATRLGAVGLFLETWQNQEFGVPVAEPASLAHVHAKHPCPFRLLCTVGTTYVLGKPKKRGLPLSSTTISIIVIITKVRHRLRLLLCSLSHIVNKKKFNFRFTVYLLSFAPFPFITFGTGSEVATNRQTRDWKIEKHYCLMYVSPGMLLILQLIVNVDLGVGKPSFYYYVDSTGLRCFRSYNGTSVQLGLVRTLHIAKYC